MSDRERLLRADRGRAWCRRPGLPWPGVPRQVFVIFLTQEKIWSIIHFLHRKRLPMNACPTFPATPVGLIYRFVAFLARHICACSLGTLPAMMFETRVQIVAPATRLLALCCRFGRRAEHARRERQTVRHASLVARRMRGGIGERRACEASLRIAEGGGRGAAAGAREWGGAAGRVSSDDGQTYGRGFDDGGRVGWRLAGTAGTTHARGEIRSNTRGCAQISAPVSRGRVANSRLASGPLALSTGSDGGASRASCEFSTGFRNWVPAPGAR